MPTTKETKEKQNEHRKRFLRMKQDYEIQRRIDHTKLNVTVFTFACKAIHYTELTFSIYTFEVMKCKQ